MFDYQTVYISQQKNELKHMFSWNESKVKGTWNRKEAAWTENEKIDCMLDFFVAILESSLFLSYVR